MFEFVPLVNKQKGAILSIEPWVFHLLLRKDTLSSTDIRLLSLVASHTPSLQKMHNYSSYSLWKSQTAEQIVAYIKFEFNR